MSKSKTGHGNIKHGFCGTKVYKVWLDMKQRCCNKKNKHYKHYGGRGIRVCDRWLESFENFYEDIGINWDNGLEIDRIDSDGDYEPTNCRWVSRLENVINRRSFSGCASKYRGVSFEQTTGKWKSRASIGKGDSKYLGVFPTEKEAAIAHDDYIIENNLPYNLNFKE